MKIALMGLAPLMMMAPCNALAGHEADVIKR